MPCLKRKSPRQMTLMTDPTAIIQTDHETQTPLPSFYYVIFADGETCDATGLEAASHNDFVLFDDRLYMPGETVSISGRTLKFDRVAVLDGGGRMLEITNCTLIGPQ